jgi:V/A-type H+-transporting ATPase subunit K
MNNLGFLGAGLVMGIAALGSAIGISIAGSATIGAWKRCYKANKPAPMTLLAFAGAPLTQTFYGYILMLQMNNALNSGSAQGIKLLAMGISSGIAIAASAIAQGKAGASGADALSDTGKGFANYIAVVGICETVALFAMVLSMASLG